MPSELCCTAVCLSVTRGALRVAELWLERGASAAASSPAAEGMGSDARRAGPCVSTAGRCPAGGMARLPVLSSVGTQVIFSCFFFFPLDERGGVTINLVSSNKLGDCI